MGMASSRKVRSWFGVFQGKGLVADVRIHGKRQVGNEHEASPAENYRKSGHRVRSKLFHPRGRAPGPAPPGRHSARSVLLRRNPRQKNEQAGDEQGDQHHQEALKGIGEDVGMRPADGDVNSDDK